jgi:hypothetical protein
VEKDSKKLLKKKGLQEAGDVQEGLDSRARTLLTPRIYPDFNNLMNMAIVTESARAEEKKEKQVQVHGAQGSTARALQRQRSFGHPMSRFQAPMQYKTQSQATSSQGPRTQFKPYNNQNAMKPHIATLARSLPTTTTTPGCVSTAVRPDTSLPTVHMPRSQQLQPSPTL